MYIHDTSSEKVNSILFHSMNRERTKVRKFLDNDDNKSFDQEEKSDNKKASVQS
jgi:hypothetical protein